MRYCLRSMDKKAKLFLLKNKENGDFNQYWYSNATIAFLAEPPERCCFLSTPSIYYAIPNPNHEAPLFLFDYDAKFAHNNPHFYQYDFNHPELIPEQYHHSFDFIVADPPFITEEVWQKYAHAIRILGKTNPQGKLEARVLLTTIEENEQFLGGLLGVEKKRYKPAIPNLVYQYCLYANYQDERLDQPNPQIPE